MPLPADPIGRRLYMMLARDRYGRWLTSQVTSILTKAFDESALLLLGEYSDITQFQRARRTQLLATINDHLTGAYDKALTFHQRQMRDYARIESRFSANDLKNLLQIGDADTAGLSFAVISAEKAQAIANLPISGLTLGDWWESAVNDMSTKMRQQIQVGLLQGEDAAKIVKRLVPTPGPDAGPVLYKQGVRSADMLVRTTLTAVENSANLATMEDMDPDITDSYRYTAVRDTRTSIICAALDGNVYKYTDPQRKMPPQHPNCRSTTIPIVNYKKLGLTNVMTPGDYKMGSMSAWLKSAGTTAQEDLLGPARASLFRSGTLSLADLVSKDVRVLTLAQLKDLAN